MKLSPQQKRSVVDPLAALRRKGARIAKAEAARPGTYFRFQDCSGGECVRFEKFAARERERFDEIVVGQFLHVERLDNRSFYGSIGGLTLWWTVRPNGDVVITHAELRDAKVGSGAFDWLIDELRKAQSTERQATRQRSVRQHIRAGRKRAVRRK